MGLREGPIEGVVVTKGEGLADGISLMVTGYGEDVSFDSASNGRNVTLTTSPTVDNKDEATVSLISIQRVDI